MTSPYGAGPSAERRRGWPLALAIVGLAGFAVVVPLVALAKVVLLAPWFGQPQTYGDAQQQAIWLIDGTVSALLAVASGIVALAHTHRAHTGRTATKVVAGFAIALGLLGTAGLGALSIGTVTALTTSNEVPASPPTCGPDSHPAVFGPESRYTPCDDDVATAQAFVDSVLPELPTTNVTVDSAGATAKSVTQSLTAPDGKFPFYEGTYPGANDGEINAVWVAAPVTCAIATWDGNVWTTTVEGLLADGGC